jgi:RNA polymerase sigma-70 factor (ECF subfamily)
MDSAVIKVAQKGDAKAMGEVLAEVAPIIYRFGMQLCGSEADAEDVLQDTLWAVATNLPKFEGRSSLATWVFTLARTACRRLQHGASGRHAAPAEALTEMPHGQSAPDEVAAARQVGNLVGRALAALSQQHREV